MDLHGSGDGGPSGWILRLHPHPLPGLRWLDFTTTPGEPATPIDLVRPPDATWGDGRNATTSLGGHFLNNVATGLLATEPTFPPDIRSTWPGHGSPSSWTGSATSLRRCRRAAPCHRSKHRSRPVRRAVRT